MLTLIDLELQMAMGCGDPECDHRDHSQLFFHSKCHPNGRTHVSYTAKSGVIAITCGACRAVIAQIKVAER